MRLGDKAKTLKTSHFGTNRSRRDVKKFGKRNTSNRGRKLGVLFDNCEKDFTLAFSQIHETII